MAPHLPLDQGGGLEAAVAPQLLLKEPFISDAGQADDTSGGFGDPAGSPASATLVAAEMEPPEVQGPGAAAQWYIKLVYSTRTLTG